MDACKNENPYGAECGDEGRLCRSCEEREAAYWADYFGIRSGMTKAERRAQLAAFAPPGRCGCGATLNTLDAEASGECTSCLNAY